MACAASGVVSQGTASGSLSTRASPARSVGVEECPRHRAADAAERERLIIEHLPLVRGLARRYADRGEPLDDLVQVGTIGLIKAIDRFDPARGFKLASFATPTILGEIRRHFRDRSWTVRVPRGIQEARAQISHAVDVLSASEGRSPSVREIAEQTDLPLDDVLDALAAGSAQRPAPLASPERRRRGGRGDRRGLTRTRLRAGRGPRDDRRRPRRACPRGSG